MAKLDELAALLAPTQKAVAKRVKLVVDAPASYLEKYASDLDDWNAEGSTDPWLALVIALVRAKVACAVDWKAAAEDIHANLGWTIAAQARLRANKKLYDAKTVLGFYDEDAHLLTKTDDFLRVCGRAVSAHGLALIELATDGDSHVLMLVPWADVARAKKLGAKLVLHSPTTPLAAPLPLVAKKRTSARLEKVAVAGYADRRFVQTPGFTTSRGQTSLVDCSTWPPKTRMVSDLGVDLVVHERTGARIVFGPATLTIEAKGTFVSLLERRPASFDISNAMWVGDLVVLFPTEPTVRVGKSRRPLVWDGKKLTAAKGLPDATPLEGTPRDRFPSFLRQGFARTGAGVDVVLWEGAGWILKGDRFVKAWTLELDLDLGHVGAPAPGAAFFYVQRLEGRRTALHLAANGASTVRLRLPHIVDGPPRTTPDGRVLLPLNRYAKPKEPVLVVVHPESDELTLVPPDVLGFRKDDQASAYGVSNGALWILDGKELRRLDWKTILALPRRPAGSAR